MKSSLIVVVVVVFFKQIVRVVLFRCFRSTKVRGYQRFVFFDFLSTITTQKNKINKNTNILTTKHHQQIKSQ